MRWVSAALTVVLAAMASAAHAADRPPNLVLILADDLGIGDVCSFGSCAAGRLTPNLDALAQAGVRFTHAYAAAPICSPSRAGLLTGRYPQRFGHEFNPDGIDRGQRESLGTPLDQKLLPQYLKPRGYATGIIGKWHLGPAPPQHPMERGFDEFFGFLHGAKLYFPKPKQQPGIHWIEEPPKAGKEKTEQNPLNPLLRGREAVTEPTYLTDAFTREAVSFIERHHDQPFFLYVPYNAPHTPLMVDDPRWQKFPGVAGDSRRVHAAMMSALDDGIGAIVDALRRQGLLEQTLIVFASDNGCPTNIDACSNDGLVGGKRILFEGGVNIPMLASWTGTIAPGRVVADPVSLLDVLPTAVDLAGAPSPPAGTLDGKSLLPLLRGEVKRFDQGPLFWRHGTNWAVRSGSWKLIGFAGLPHPLLFDLASEAGEHRDVAAAHPDQVKSLTTLFQAWEAKTVKPLWGSDDGLWISLEDVMAGKPMIPLDGPRPGAVEIP
jgi:arylsulfatase A-like enzyme